MFVHIKMNVKTPTVPNYLLVDSTDQFEPNKIAIEELTDDQLREIGMLWTAKLVLHARKKRTATPAATPAKR